MYRTQNTDAGNFNEDRFITSTIAPCKAFILYGDFNLDLLKMEEHTMTDDFFDMSHHMISNITRPTRITETSTTLIDNFYVNTTSYCYSSSIVYDDISDYFLYCLLSLSLRLYLLFQNLVRGNIILK